MEGPRVVGLVTAGEPAGVQVHDQPVVLPRPVGGYIEVELVRVAVAVGDVGINRSHRVVPIYGEIVAEGIAHQLDGRRKREDGNEYPHVKEAPENAVALFGWLPWRIGGLGRNRRISKAH